MRSVYAYSFLFSVLIHGICIGALVCFALVELQSPVGDGRSGIGVSFVIEDDESNASSDLNSTEKQHIETEYASIKPEVIEQSLPPVQKEELVFLKEKLPQVKPKVIQNKRKPLQEKKPEPQLAQSSNSEANNNMAPANSSVNQGQSAQGADSAFSLIGQAGSGAIRPIPVRAPKPPYPYQARQDGFEGQVALDAIIDADGNVQKANVARSSGRSDCDEAAQKTILERWHFEPASLNGQNIQWREKIVVSFKLR